MINKVFVTGNIIKGNEKQSIFLVEQGERVRGREGDKSGFYLTQFTRTPLGANSPTRLRIRLSVAALAAEYASIAGNPIVLQSPEFMMMLPLFLIISGAASLQSSNGPTT